MRRPCPIKLAVDILQWEESELEDDFPRYVEDKAETYGEVIISFRNFSDFLSLYSWDSVSSFVDLGSGGGMLAILVAAVKGVKSTGIEIRQDRHDFAKKLHAKVINSKLLCHGTLPILGTFQVCDVFDFYGFHIPDVAFYRGTFMDDDYRQVVAKSDAVFSNNYLFPEELNLKIMAMTGKSLACSLI